MSERTIKFIFKGEERKVRVFANYEECKKAFQNEFSLTDEEMDKISLHYRDEDNDDTFLDSNDDYTLFLESNCTDIEGQENKNMSEKPDPMKSASVFYNKKVESIKVDASNNLTDSYNRDNSEILENSANIDLDFSKNNSKGLDFENINEINNLIDKVAAKKEEESKIVELQKQMEELKLKHEEEKRLIEEENKKKYNEALAKKETELKKKIKKEKEKQLKEYKIIKRI